MNAGKKAATPIHELLGPYSLYRRQAEVKAVAVCPEGKDRKSEPSGLSTPANDLIEQIVMPISAKNGGYQHRLPLAPAFYSRQFHSEHDHYRNIGQKIIIAIGKGGKMCVTQIIDILVGTF